MGHMQKICQRFGACRRKKQEKETYARGILGTDPPHMAQPQIRIINRHGPPLCWFMGYWFGSPREMKCLSDIFLDSQLAPAKRKCTRKPTKITRWPPCKQHRLEFMAMAPPSKKQSCETTNWNMPCRPHTERMFFTCLGGGGSCRRGCLSRHTANDISISIYLSIYIYIYIYILEISVRNTKARISKIAPTERHDGKPWQPSDVRRRRVQPNQYFPFGATSDQCRGDWPWSKTPFGFGGWNPKIHVGFAKQTVQTYHIGISKALQH